MKCEMCGRECKRAGSHIRHKHNMTCKQNDSRGNLIFLNRPTHSRTNFNRNEWQRRLTKINKQIIREES